MIEAIDLTKEFRIPVKKHGLKGSIHQLFHGDYKIKKAVSHVNFSIKQGEAVAYIGPNGAGKSTTIKMLTGLLKPSSGVVLVNGLDPQKDRIRNAKNIGVVFGQRTQLWWDIPVRDSYELLKNIYEVPDNIYQENMKLFYEIFGLKEFIDNSARKLSLGQRMRADLAAALLHNPSTIFLDEPTIGLDIGTKESMRELVRKINRERGVTIVLTSHDLKDVEDICQRIIVIDDGNVVCDENIEQLNRAYPMDRGISITLTGASKNLLDKIRLLDGITYVEMPDSHSIEIDFSPNKYTAFELVQVVNHYASIIDFKLRDPSIERMIERIYRTGEKIR